GFLRSKDALIQTIGRAARNVRGMAILYADRVTDSMRAAMDETARRRAKQLDWNAERGIAPETIVKSIDEVLGSVWEADYVRGEAKPAKVREDEILDPEALEREIARLEKEMRKAAKSLDFESAAELRDRIRALRQREVFGFAAEPAPKGSLQRAAE